MYEHYKCDFCGYPLDPKGESTAELVSGWIVKGRIAKQTERTWRFAHKVCIEHEPKNESQGDLFSA